MSANNNFMLTQRNHGSLMLISFRLLAVLLFLSVLSVSRAAGQTDYSTMWIDDSQAEDGIAYVVAAGVTDDDYTSGGDSIGLETRITSPNGRTAFGVGIGDVSARSEVVLPWNWQDTGSFFAETVHQPLCNGGEGWGGDDGILIRHRVVSGGIAYWIRIGFQRCNQSRHSSLLHSFVPEDSVNVITYQFDHEVGPVGNPPKTFYYYYACDFNDHSPANNCFYFAHVADSNTHPGGHGEGLRATYQRIALSWPFGYFTKCIRLHEETLPTDPCPNG